MAQSDHQQVLAAQGHLEEVQQRVIQALDALGLFRRARSERLGEDIIYNEYVWGDSGIPIAEFLRALPVNEREVLAEISSQAMNRPGVPLRELGVDNVDLLAAASKVGFIDPVGVVTANRNQSFAFSPSLEQVLRQQGSTDSLHQRKLFVAHILFGHHFGFPGTGRIHNPVVLVRALLNRGRVGPATAIATDYPMIESQGIARVELDESHPGRAYLRLVNEEVVRDSLPLIEAALGLHGHPGGGEEPLQALWVPGSYSGPERMRLRAANLRPGPAKDVFDATIAELRKRTAKRLRREDLFA
jgi:hypothetical protein